MTIYILIFSSKHTLHFLYALHFRTKVGTNYFRYCSFAGRIDICSRGCCNTARAVIHPQATIGATGNACDILTAATWPQQQRSLHQHLDLPCDEPPPAKESLPPPSPLALASPPPPPSSPPGELGLLSPAQPVNPMLDHRMLFTFFLWLRFVS